MSETGEIQCGNSRMSLIDSSVGRTVQEKMAEK